MKKKIWTDDISKYTDWGGDSSTSNLPVSGEKVQKFIKDSLEEKFGTIYFDENDSQYLVFADDINRDLYLNDRETYASLLLGSFDAPAPYTAEITNLTPSKTILKGQTGTTFSYNCRILSRDGNPTGEEMRITYIFSNGSVKQTVNRIYTAEEGLTGISFLVDDYISTGINTVVITVTGRTSNATTTAAVTFTVVDLQLTSTFDFSKPISTDSLQIDVPYTISGTGLKYIEWFVDGTSIGSVDAINDINVTRVKNIVLPSDITTGKHNLQFRSYIVVDGINNYSNTLYYDFVVADNNVTAILLGIVLPPSTNSGAPSLVPTFTAKQYQTNPYQLATYNGNRTLSVSVYDNNVEIQNINTDPETLYNMSYTPTTVGEHILSFNATDVTAATINVNVETSDVDISEATDNLVLKLSAKGRNNNETNPATWTYGNITTTFSTGFVFNAQSGWVDDTLIIPSGQSITINIAPFSSTTPFSGTSIGRGRTVEIDFETANVSDENASIVSLRGDNNTEFNITSASATLTTSQGAQVSTRFRPGDRQHISFIVNQTLHNDALLLTMVNNGILERADKFTTTDSVNMSGLLTIGGSGCTVKIHSIRIYDRNITVDEAFCNYAVDSNNLLDIANRNDIYVGGMIDPSKVNRNIPVMLITGNIDFLLNINSKENKGKYNPTPVDIEYHNLQDPTKDFTLTDADIRLQGTSSISYPRKNFRIYSKKKTDRTTSPVMTDADGNVIKDGLYSFKDGAQPVTCWCLKADYAESSGSHNTGVARLWNKVMSEASIKDDEAGKSGLLLKTEAQTAAAADGYEYDVRTTVDGFPIVLFQRNDENSSWTCFGQYNFNNDKSTEGVFGFTYNSDRFDNENVQCFEFLDSDQPLALFTEIDTFDTDWSNAWESRYPDTSTPNLAPLKALATWINSCSDNQAEWDANWKNHFDPYKLVAYYIYLLRFGAVDQTVKNAMFMTEDGVHWFFINYDNDTILGIDNASHLFDTWDYDLTTQTPGGGYYYAGKNKSVLWKRFEGCEEAMRIVKIVDEALYNKGLTYSNIINMFDTEQSSKWCERIYNENGRYKYILPSYSGSNVLYMLQGSRQSHRHWWLQHRLEKYDNLWGTGTYKGRDIQLRTDGQYQFSATDTYTFTPDTSSYYGYSVASTMKEHEWRTAGTSYTSTPLGSNVGVGNFIYIHNANNIRILNLSGMIDGLAVVDLKKAINEASGESRIKQLILGDGTNTNSLLTDISSLATQKQLEYLDIRGYQGISNVTGLSSLINLHTFLAANSGLTSFAPAAGAILTNVSLPSTIQAITLNGADVSSLSYTPNSTLSTVELRNVRGSWDIPSFINNWITALNSSNKLDTATLTLTGIDWVNTNVTNLCKLATIGNLTLTGKVTYSSITTEEYNQIIAAFGTGVFDEKAAFRIVVTTMSAILNGSLSIFEGESVNYTVVVVPSNGVPQTDWAFSIYGKTPMVDEDDNTYYVDGNVTLYSDGRLVSTEDGSSTHTVVIRAAKMYQGQAIQASGNITVTKRTYPTGLTITIPTGSQTEFTNATASESATYNYALTGTYNTAPVLTATLNGLDDLAGSSIVITPTSTSGGTITLTVGPVTSGTNITAPIVLTGSFTTGHTSLTAQTASNIQIYVDEIILSVVTNPVAMEAIATFAADSRITLQSNNQLYASEAKKFTTLSYCFERNTYLQTFDELQYFTNLSSSGLDATFRGCTNLTSVVLPQNAKSLSQTFADCRSLTSIRIPYSVRSMQNTFNNCSALTNVVFEGDLENQNDNMFTMANDVFYRCSNLEVVELPARMFYYDSIPTGYRGSGIFNNCVKLKKIIIHGESVYLAGSFVNSCNSLKRVDFYCKRIRLGEYAFNECFYLNKMYLKHPDNFIKSINLITNSYSLFTSLFKNQENEDLPDDRLGLGAFYDLESGELITSCTITSSGRYALYKTYMPNVTIEGNTIPEGAFSSSGVERITFADDVSDIRINSSAFSNTKYITSITPSINNNVSYIGSMSLYQATSPALSTEFYDTDVTVEANSFNNPNFSSIKLAGQITGILNNNVFSGGSETVIDLSESTITSLLSSVINNITGLKTVKFPSTLKQLDAIAIYKCNSLSNIYCYATTAPSWTASESVTTRTGGTIYVPQNATGYDAADTQWKKLVDKLNWTISYTL